MKRSMIEKVLLALMVALALVAVGCDDDDDGIGGATSGNLLVDIDTRGDAVMAPATLAPATGELYIRWSYIAVRSGPGADEEILLDTDDADFVNVMDDIVLGPFDVTPGTYDQLGEIIGDMYVVDGDNTCQDVTIEGEPESSIVGVEEWFDVEGGVIEITEDGTATVIVDLPIEAAACDVDGGTGRVFLDELDDDVHVYPAAGR